VALASMAVAQPALAQAPGRTFATSDLWARQEMERQRAVGLQNEMMSLESQLRADAAERDLQAAWSAPTPRGASNLSASDLPRISDERLARSNAAVRAAT